MCRGLEAAVDQVSFVQEGAPIPVRGLTAEGAMLEPRKLAVIVTLSAEMIAGSNAEADYRCAQPRHFPRHRRRTLRRRRRRRCSSGGFAERYRRDGHLDDEPTATGKIVQSGALTAYGCATNRVDNLELQW